jgi:ABC-2 type transport system permease protein
MSRYFQIWAAQIRYSVMKDLGFKGNFLLWTVVELAWFLLQIAFVEVLYLNVNEIAGWSKWEMVLLVATSHLVQQIFQTFFMSNCNELPEHIRTGKLDFFLALPAHPQFLVSTRLFDLSGSVNALLALGLCGWALSHTTAAFSAGNLLGFALLVMLGVAVHYAVSLSLVTLSFWMVRGQSFMMAYYQLFQIARQPSEAFRGLARVIFTWVLPMLLVANVPAQTLLGQGSLRLALLFAVVTAVLFWGANRFFWFGLSRYTSASS